MTTSPSRYLGSLKILDLLLGPPQGKPGYLEALARVVDVGSELAPNRLKGWRLDELKTSFKTIAWRLSIQSLLIDDFMKTGSLSTLRKRLIYLQIHLLEGHEEPPMDYGEELKPEPDIQLSNEAKTILSHLNQSDRTNGMPIDSKINPCLAKLTTLSAKTVSKHLNALKEHGLVKDNETKSGNRRWFSTNKGLSYMKSK
jgi:DNA-binding transcriptional ArsR family regulator